MKYFIDQKLTLLTNQYFVYQGESKDSASLVAFVQQKRLAMREKITFYKDQSKKEVLFTVKARGAIDLGAKYDVVSESDKKLGVIQKAFKSSLFRSTWHILNDKEDSPAIIIQERSQPVAILRRIWDFVPIVGEIPFIFKYHFDFNDAGAGKRIASFQKVTLFRDQYSLEIDESQGDATDWRIFVALGVMLDALQSR